MKVAVPAERAWFRWVVLSLSTGVVVGSSVCQLSPAAIGPVMAPALHVNLAQFGLLSAAIWGGIVFGTVPAGLLSDRYGERIVVGVGVSAEGILVMVASLAHSFVPLFMLLLAASAFGGCSSPGGSKAIQRWFAPNRRSGAMGIRQAGASLGGLIAALLLPVVAIAADSFVALRVAGVFALAAGLCFLVFYRKVGDDQQGGGRGPRFRELFLNRRFMAVTAFAFIMMGGLGASTTYMPLAYHQVAGLPIALVAALFAIYQAVAFVSRIAWGSAVDRLADPRPSMAGTAALGVLGCLALSSVGQGTPFLVLLPLTLLLSLSFNGFSGFYVAAAAGSVDLRQAAAGVGLSLTISLLGLFLMAPAFGFIVDHLTFHAAWLVLAGWAGLALVPTALIPRFPERFPA